MILGPGIDIVDINRFPKLLESNLKNRFYRIFTQDELNYCYSKPSTKKIAESMAVRFAAKEALVKAVGLGFGNGIYLSTIEVLNDEYGKPYFKLKVNVHNKIIQFLNCSNYKLHLSLANEANVAIAQVIIEKL